MSDISSSIKSNVRELMDTHRPQLDLVEFKKMFMYDKLYTMQIFLVKKLISSLQITNVRDLFQGTIEYHKFKETNWYAIGGTKHPLFKTLVSLKKCL